jgi:YesN/AraC family two-component response regulator
MPYSVLIVEDESASSWHLRTIIEQKCPDYQVLGCEASGAEALITVRRGKPDLLLTDIRMPGMDGIELVRQAKLILPSLHCVVVSGYQDFDYAKGAIQTGVDDYLLKPVTPKNLTETMEKIAERLDESYYQERCTLFRSLIADVFVEKWKLEKYLPGDGGYWLAVFRENGLPRRFGNSKVVEQFSEPKDTLYLYGRDEKEVFFCCRCEDMSFGEFRLMLAGYGDKTQCGYSTVVMMPDAVSAGELPGAVNRLYQELRRHLVIGRSRLLLYGQNGKKPYSHYALSADDIGRIQQVAQNRMTKALLKEIETIVRRSLNDNCPQIYLEDITRQFFYLIRMYYETDDWIDSFDYMLDDAFFFALNADDLVGNLRDLVEKIIEKTLSLPEKLDSPETFGKIRRYLLQHLSGKQGIKGLCGEFGISQSYMSKLFRKYAGRSFNEYLVELRMERAKQLMRENPGILIKNVAAMVGYEDQLYFSRLFRSYTGKPPSSYIKNLSGNKARMNRDQISPNNNRTSKLH